MFKAGIRLPAKHHDRREANEKNQRDNYGILHGRGTSLGFEKSRNFSNQRFHGVSRVVDSWSYIQSYAQRYK